MGKDYQEIDDRIRRFVEHQKVFFVATAPREDDGHINLSPKGLDSLRVTGPRQLVYADTGGSGIETVAHLKQNGRIVIMLCAFDGPPKIFRFYGRGRVLEPHDDDFDTEAARFPNMPTIRNLIVVEVARIRDSCGYGVPNYRFEGERDSLVNWANAKSEQELVDYRIDNNETSLDGLPGLDIDKLR
ncbi:MAG: pyridoxamine 5'-phosphate oxidase family protein [Woeseiaceae bacterium]|nr:pyridoxamine 5'-phosphate oxidase family protein [Woeseiaceae bacterium]